MNIVLYKKTLKERFVIFRALVFMSFSMLFYGKACLIIKDNQLAYTSDDLISGKKTIGIFRRINK
ncbi:hypothetical protein RG55_05020 [Escherichia coli]|nr:hypothetical protein RG54_19460 [Escherichia coli]APK97884.1 hypothetical protein RG55_05020 [Escherichia coli]